VHLAELVPYVGALWGAVQLWGVEGAALAWTVRMSLIAAVLLWADHTPLVRLRPLRMPIVLLGLSSALAFGLPWHDGLRLAGSALLGAATVAWAWGTAPATIKDIARAFFRAPLPAASPEP